MDLIIVFQLNMQSCSYQSLKSISKQRDRCFYQSKIHLRSQLLQITKVQSNRWEQNIHILLVLPRQSHVSLTILSHFQVVSSCQEVIFIKNINHIQQSIIQNYQQYHVRTLKARWHKPIQKTITISLGSFFIGVVLVFYDIIFKKCANANITQNDDSLSKFIAGIVPLAAAFGSILSWILYKYLSRRQALWTISLIGIAGSSLFFRIVFIANSDYCFWKHDPFLVTGRILQGLAVGAFAVNCLLILSQIAPIQLKMVLGISYQLSVQLGIICAYTIEYSIKKQDMLILALLLTSILPLVLQIFVLMFKYKEQTVKYLLSKGKNEEAKSLITTIYKQEHSLQIFLDYQAQYQTQQSINQSSFFMDFDMKKIRIRSIFIGVVLSVVQQMSGINFYNLQIGKLKEEWSFVSTMSQFIGTLLLVMFNLTYFKLFQKLFSQRSKMILYGTLVSAIIMTVFIIAFITNHFNTQATVEIILLNLFMLNYGFTIGPIICIYLSQILDPVSLQIAIGVNWMFAFINVTGISLLVQQKMSDKFVIPIVSVGTCLVFLISNYKYEYVVQTKNQTPLQITRKINNLEICGS